MAQLVSEPELLPGQNQRLAALVLLHGMCKANPAFMPTFIHILGQPAATRVGTDKEAHVMSLLLTNKGSEVLAKFSASQIIKNDCQLPPCPSKTEVLDVIDKVLLVTSPS